MKKFVMFCFVLVAGLAIVEAQQQSFSFTGAEIQAFKYRANANSELVNMKNKVDTVYMVLNLPEMALNITFRDGTPDLFFMCLQKEITQMNGNPVAKYDAWLMDTKTGERGEKFSLMNFQYGNRYVYLISKGSVEYVDLQLKP